MGSNDTTCKQSTAEETSGVYASLGRVHVTLTSCILGIRKGGEQRFNTPTSEVASGASVYPSLRLHVAGTSEEGAIPVSHLRYQRLEKEESRALTPNS
jgi:hypothetical protein